VEEVSLLLQAIKHLVNGSVSGAGIVAAFHTRRVLPLMRRERHLDEMVPGASLVWTMLRSGELDHEAI
jgi:uncharacterized membrane-anchored protein